MKLLASLLLSVYLFGCAPPAVQHPAAQPAPVAWSVYFSPNGGCTDAIVKELDNAKTSILVQAYSFTSAPIAKGLVNAHERGVRVEVILDKSHLTEKYSNAPFLAKSGILVKIDSAHAIADQLRPLDLRAVYERKAGLEDVFLKLTGRTLVD